MTKAALTWVVVALTYVGQVAVAQTDTAVFESDTPATPAGELDELVFARLSSVGIQPVLCSDAAFVRRAYLDVIGTLPTADEARAFIDDPDAAQ